MNPTDDTILVAHLELAKEDYLDWLKGQYLGMGVNDVKKSAVRY
jgi:hypothetical protein